MIKGFADLGAIRTKTRVREFSEFLTVTVAFGDSRNHHNLSVNFWG